MTLGAQPTLAECRAWIVSSIEKEQPVRAALFLLLWARMPQTVVAHIRAGRRVVGLVTLGAIGRIGTARYHIAGVPVVAGVPIVIAGVPVVIAGVPVVVVIVISVAVAGIVGVIVGPVAITQSATGR